MTAYIIGRIQVSDPERYKDYTAKTPELIAAHGGRFIVRGGEAATLEGTEESRRLVVVEFPSLEAARAFYYGAEYQSHAAIRWETAQSDLVLVEGV